MDAMNNDLMAPLALASMWKMLKDNTVSDSEKLSVLYSMDKILGLDLDKIEAKTEERVGGEREWKLVEERAKAKKEKNWARADEIRDELSALGYVVKDTPKGPVLEKTV